MKTVFSIILILVFAYLGIWLFNHINAWLGIAFEIAVVLLTVKYSHKIFK